MGDLKPMPDEAPRILIVRLSALGDIVHALPVLAALRRRWPGAFIGWLCEPAGAPLVREHPLLDAMHMVPRKALREDFLAAVRGPARELVRELKACRYDWALDIQGLTKSAVWPWLARVPRRVTFAGRAARELAGPLATDRVAPAPGALHIVERNLALLRPLGFEADPAGAPPEFPLHLSDAARARAAAILGAPQSLGGGGAAAGRQPESLALITPGAGWATKRWAPERFGELARRLAGEARLRVAFVWGPGEQPLVRAALAGAGEHALAALPDAGLFGQTRLGIDPGVYAFPATTIPELVASIAQARLFIGGDTGPTHLAAALGIPTVSMMGPLDARRNGPNGTHCVTIQHAVPRRAPWWANHRRWCDPATDLRHVTVEEVWQACRRQLERPAHGDAV